MITRNGFGKGEDHSAAPQLCGQSCGPGTQPNDGNKAHLSVQNQLTLLPPPPEGSQLQQSSIETRRMSSGGAAEGAEWTNVGIMWSAAVLFPGGGGGGWWVGRAGHSSHPPTTHPHTHTLP